MKLYRLINELSKLPQDQEVLSISDIRESIDIPNKFIIYLNHRVMSKEEQQEKQWEAIMEDSVIKDVVTEFQTRHYIIKE